MHNLVRTYLEASLDGSLLPSACRELEAHLEACPGCRRELEELRQTRQWMKALVTKELVAPAPGFYARVQARVDAEKSQVWPIWQLFPVFTQQLGFALITLLLLLSTYFVALRQTERGTATAQLMQDAPMIHAETPALTADAHVNRERVLMAILTPEARPQGE